MYVHALKGIMESYSKKGHLLLFVLICLFLCLICIPSPANAGYPIDGANGVYFYNVGAGQFSVAWEVDESSTACSVRLYYDINGTQPVPASYYTINLGSTPNQIEALNLGVMQVDVKNLPIAPDTYYVQTISEVGSTMYIFPDPTNGEGLVPITTEPVCPTVFPPDNGYIFIKVYDQFGLEPMNQICQGVILFISAQQGANQSNYPITTSAFVDDNNGFPGTGCSYELGLGYFRLGNNSDDNYWRWNESYDYNLTITCLGGQAKGVGHGKRVINPVFYGSWIPSLVPPDCLENVNGCDCSFGICYSQIQLPGVPLLPLKGLVYNLATGEPLPDVIIRLANNGVTTSSGTDGFYSFPDAIDGTERIVFLKSPLFTKNVFKKIHITQGRELTINTALAPVSSPGVIAPLTGKGRISGYVYDESTGNPIPSAKVIIYLSNIEQLVLITDNTGFYHHPSMPVPAGVYTVSYTKPPNYKKLVLKNLLFHELDLVIDVDLLPVH